MRIEPTDAAQEVLSVQAREVAQVKHDEGAGDRHDVHEVQLRQDRVTFSEEAKQELAESNPNREDDPAALSDRYRDMQELAVLHHDAGANRIEAQLVDEKRAATHNESQRVQREALPPQAHHEPPPRTLAPHRDPGAGERVDKEEKIG